MSVAELSLEIDHLSISVRQTDPPAKKKESLVDSQKSKVYKAERDALEPMCRIFLTTKDVLKFIDKMIARAPIQRRYGKHLTYQESGTLHGQRTFVVKFNENLRSWAWGGRNGITLHGKSGWTWSEWVIIHEIAHVIQHRRFGSSGTQGHGREFCAIYLDLVRFTLGREAYEALKSSFRSNRVKFTKKRNVNFSEEQKAEMRERMKIARASLPKREPKPENLITCSVCQEKMSKAKFRTHFEELHQYKQDVFCERCGTMFEIRHAEASRVCSYCKRTRISI